MLLPWLANPPRTRWERRFLCVLFLLLAVLLVPWLGRIPRTYADESWAETMAGYTLAFEGHTRNPGVMGWGGSAEHFIQPRLFTSVILAGIYRLAGFGMTQSRAAATLFAFVLLFAVYKLMRRLFGPACAAGIATLTVIDPWVFLTGRQARPEMALAALLWLSFYLLLEGVHRGSSWRMFGGGVLIGLAGWTHPNAAVFAAAGLATFALIGAIHRGALRLWIIAGAGAIVGFLPFAAYVLYVQSISDIRFIDQLHPARRAPYARPLTEMLRTEGLRWSHFIRWPQRAPVLLLYLWGMAWAAWRGTRSDRTVLSLLLASALIMPLMVAVEWTRYLVVLTPALAALVWRALAALRTGSPAAASTPSPSHARLRRIVFALGLATIAVTHLGATAALAYAHRHANYTAWARRVAERIPIGARVMGNIALWTALHDREFIANYSTDFNTDWPSVDAAVEHIRKYRPEYLVQTSHQFLGLGGLRPRTDDLSSTDFGQACDRVTAEVPAQVVTEFYDPDYGATRVWRLTWPVGDSPRSPGAQP